MHGDVSRLMEVTALELETEVEKQGEECACPVEGREGPEQHRASVAEVSVAETDRRLDGLLGDDVVAFQLLVIFVPGEESFFINAFSADGGGGFEMH